METWLNLLAIVCLMDLASAARAEPRPNIILMMADGVGYSDLGCYGGEIKILTLDAIALGGVRFTQFYNTDAINDHAARFVTEHKERNADEPFFLYKAHPAAHWPTHAKETDIAKLRGKYDESYDAIRAARLAKIRLSCPNIPAIGNYTTSPPIAPRSPRRSATTSNQSRQDRSAFPGRFWPR